MDHKNKKGQRLRQVVLEAIESGFETPETATGEVMRLTKAPDIVYPAVHDFVINVFADLRNQRAKTLRRVTIQREVAELSKKAPQMWHESLLRLHAKFLVDSMYVPSKGLTRYGEATIEDFEEHITYRLDSSKRALAEAERHTKIVQFMRKENLVSLTGMTEDQIVAFHRSLV